MKTYQIKISEGHVTGFGVGPITNRNTLIRFVLKVSKKIKTLFQHSFSKNKNIKNEELLKMNENNKPLFI